MRKWQSEEKLILYAFGRIQKRSVLMNLLQADNELKLQKVFWQQQEEEMEKVKEMLSKK